jgi:hypothetical protein
MVKISINVSESIGWYSIFLCHFFLNCLFVAQLVEKVTEFSTFRVTEYSTLLYIIGT